jgi:hypothetical protein
MHKKEKLHHVFSHLCHRICIRTLNYMANTIKEMQKELFKLFLKCFSFFSVVRALLSPFSWRYNLENCIWSATKTSLDSTLRLSIAWPGEWNDERRKVIENQGMNEVHYASETGMKLLKWFANAREVWISKCISLILVLQNAMQNVYLALKCKCAITTDSTQSIGELFDFDEFYFHVTLQYSNNAIECNRQKFTQLFCRKTKKFDITILTMMVL